MTDLRVSSGDELLAAPGTDPEPHTAVVTFDAASAGSIAPARPQTAPLQPPGPAVPAPAVDDPATRAARAALVRLLHKESAAIRAAWTERHLGLGAIRAAAAAAADQPDLTAFYRDAYLRPLLQLLHGTLARTAPEYRAIYLDERMRFAVPADVTFAAQDALLGELLVADTADLIARIPDGQRRAAARLLTDLHAPLTQTRDAKPVNLLLIGDCIMTEVRAFLVGECRDLGTDVRIRHQYLSFERGIELDVSQLAGHLESGATDLIGISFFTFEGLPPYRALLAEAAKLSPAERSARVESLLRLVRQIVASLRASSTVPILLHSACGLPLDRIRRRVPFIAALPSAVADVISGLNAGLRDLAGGVENVILIDEAAAIGPAGLRAAARYVVPRNIRNGSLFHTTAVGPALASAYAPVVDAFARLRKTKVLLVDFDNTLWSGVMADGEVVHDLRAQKLLRRLRDAGILLVALSKNDVANIRWSEMALAPEDFVLHKINWNQKAQSVAEAAQLLDVGLDTFCVIDDNPVERRLISDAYPVVQVLDPTQPQTWAALEMMLAFPNTTQTAEAAQRTALYREAANRREAMVAQLDYPEMMRSLGLRATFAPAKPKDLARIHELLARTNQFNTTTKRRTLGELKNCLAGGAQTIFVCSLSDRFGNLGIVGVSITETTAEAVILDSVVMSCRAMGFGLEMLLVRGPLDHVFAELGERRPVRGLFVRSERNEPASTLFEKAGFTYDDAAGYWTLPLAADLPAVPDWLTVNGVSSDGQTANFR